jgi:hypothetical protein
MNANAMENWTKNNGLTVPHTNSNILWLLGYAYNKYLLINRNKYFCPEDK